MSRRSRSLKLLEPQEPHQACCGKPLPLPSLDYILSHVNPVMIFISCNSNIHFNITFRMIFRSSKCFHFLKSLSSISVQILSLGTLCSPTRATYVCSSLRIRDEISHAYKLVWTAASNLQRLISAASNLISPLADRLQDFQTRRFPQHFVPRSFEETQCLHSLHSLESFNT